MPGQSPAIVVAAVAVIAAALPNGSASAQGDHFKVLNVFGTDGASPSGPILTDRRGNIFGTTYNGSASNQDCPPEGCGTVFESSPPTAGGASWNTRIIYSFTFGVDGGFPQSPLALAPDGALYGTTMGSRAAPNGNVYGLVPPTANGGAWTFENIYAFTNGTDGTLSGSYAGLVLDHGTLYGVATYGGDGACNVDNVTGCGTFFRLSRTRTAGAPWGETTLFTFRPAGTGAYPADIVGPDKAGNFYIATQQHYGALEQLSPPLFTDHWTDTVIATFSRGGGVYPNNLLLAQDGSLYGTAGGTIFHLAPPAGGTGPWVLNTLYTLTGRYGPTSLAFGPKNTLIGVVFGEIDFYAGDIFQLTPPAKGTTWSYKELYNVNAHGPSRNPVNIVPGWRSKLYGALNGGDSDAGDLFELK